MRLPSPTFLLALAAAATAAQQDGASRDAAPPFAYRTVELHGWTVRVQEELHAEEALCGEVLDLMKVKLWEVARRLPPPVVARLRSVTIRVHLDREGCRGGVYHPSAKWLREHGLPADWARGIEFGNARNFLAWSRAQPAMVLHELAHAWEHQVLGEDARAALRRVFAATRDAGSLDAVLDAAGKRRRHYALGNPAEFFAEMSEAWWWTNDFEPFVRAEVLDRFPEIARLMQDCWAPPRPDAAGEDAGEGG